MAGAYRLARAFPPGDRELADSGISRSDVRALLAKPSHAEPPTPSLRVTQPRAPVPRGRSLREQGRRVQSVQANSPNVVPHEDEETAPHSSPKTLLPQTSMSFPRTRLSCAMKNIPAVHVIAGGSLAASRWQIAARRVPVVLHEMRPQCTTAAHKTAALADRLLKLVSFRR